MRQSKKDDPDSRYESIYRTIRDRIALLQYPPGTLLSENALAREFGVSRTPIRRILRRLEFEGLVTTGHGAGTLVTTVDLKSLRDVYALRMKLRELIGELSPVTDVAEADIAALEELVERVEVMRDRRDLTELARLYNEFQEHMLCFIGNRPLREISERLYYQTARVWLDILPEMDWGEEVDIMRNEIAAVIQALQAGDLLSVGQIRRDHLAMFLGRVKRYLGGASETDIA